MSTDLTDGGQRAEAVRVELPREPRCGAMARRVLERHLSDRLGEDALADAKIVVSELVDNAYLHGEGAIELRLAMLDDRVRMDVIDEGRGASIAPREQVGLERTGHGLRLVDKLSLAWGAGEGTTHVWSELPI